LLIDEPELGLSPRVQTVLAEFLRNEARRAEYFPHLHRVFVATHSHLFLHREDLSCNFIVRKDGYRVSVQQVKTMSDLHHLQFNLLGNSLESLFLPSAIVLVEGSTDVAYIEKVISLFLTGKRVTVIRTGGDPKAKLHTLRDALGDLQRSPLRDRIFVVVDASHSRALKEDLVRMGLPGDNFIAWSRNGIEYVYPTEVMARIFSCNAVDLGGLRISSDVVAVGAMALRKTELCKQVVLAMDDRTVLPEELESLVGALRRAIE
jgi:hypothetical protein